MSYLKILIFKQIQEVGFTKKTKKKQQQNKTGNLTQAAKKQYCGLLANSGKDQGKRTYDRYYIETTLLVMPNKLSTSPSLQSSNALSSK